MDGLPDAEAQRNYVLHQIQRLRRIAAECRELAPHIHFRLHQDRLFQAGQQCDVEADRLEAAMLRDLE